MALDTPVTYHVALLSILAAAYVNSLKLCAGGSQRSYRSGALLNDISVFPDRSFKPCLHEGQITAVFLKLWSADHKWSSGSALVVLLD